MILQKQFSKEMIFQTNNNNNKKTLFYSTNYSDRHLLIFIMRLLTTIYIYRSFSESCQLDSVGHSFVSLS